jgi:hypothetical protein
VLTALPADLVILLLRVGLVVLLYLFLFSVVVLIQRELHAESLLHGGERKRGQLVVIDPGTTARRPGDALPLQAVTRLGRSAENSVVLEDQFVSAVHAIVLLRDGRWWVRDAGSTNGTVLNGSNVVDESPLHDGDELQVGGVRLRVST